MRSKARVTITLAPEVLDQVDQLIDGERVLNRSHAIELLIRQSLQPQVSSAAILAGGGSGEGPIAPLLEVAGRPLIRTTIKHLARHGISDVFILAGPHEDQIRQSLADNSSLETSLEFIQEGESKGTAGAVKLVEDRLGPEPLLVVHGDVLTDIDLTEFIRFHKEEGALVTIAVKPRDAERRYGKVMLQGNRITDFSAAEESQGVSIVNTGVYLLQPEALALIKGESPSFFEQDLFPQLAAAGELSAFIFQGVWFDISQPDSYKRAKERWEHRE